ncbi:hypothetical protein COCON_G00186720 [Conger conger]|uniref:Secreted protein n=1 Tax=Conger conger TaxID=82655 RepID=A0A9Q1HRQ8_CONCO|nr:uncharacterized protein LOC133108572 [Conger conger]KAJ8256520.1 hypothetical protein COCON_G00186720 [Conger conger]
MLATMLTAMYLAVRASEQLGLRWVHPEPLPYLLASPTPWQVHCVSQGRRSSRVEENNADGNRSNSAHLNRAATTIQCQYRKHQQRRHKARDQ